MRCRHAWQHQKVEFLTDRVPERAGLAPRRLDRDDRLPDDGGGPGQGKREDVGPASHAPVAGVQGPDRPIVHERQAELVVPHAERPERGPKSATDSTEIDRERLPVGDDDHVSRRRLHSS